MRASTCLALAALAVWTLLAAASTHAAPAGPAREEPLILVGRGYYTVGHVVLRDMNEVLAMVVRQQPAAVRLRVCENAKPDDVERLLPELRLLVEGRVWMERVKPKMLECTRPEVHSEPA